MARTKRVRTKTGSESYTTKTFKGDGSVRTTHTYKGRGQPTRSTSFSSKGGGVRVTTTHNSNGWSDRRSYTTGPKKSRTRKGRKSKDGDLSFLAIFWFTVLGLIGWGIYEVCVFIAFYYNKLMTFLQSLS